LTSLSSSSIVVVVVVAMVTKRVLDAPPLFYPSRPLRPGILSRAHTLLHESPSAPPPRLSSYTSLTLSPPPQPPHPVPLHCSRSSVCFFLIIRQIPPPPRSSGVTPQCTRYAHLSRNTEAYEWLLSTIIWCFAYIRTVCGVPLLCLSIPFKVHAWCTNGLLFYAITRTNEKHSVWFREKRGEKEHCTKRYLIFYRVQCQQRYFFFRLPAVPTSILGWYLGGMYP
jgi:hypothetical protein